MPQLHHQSSSLAFDINGFKLNILTHITIHFLIRLIFKFSQKQKTYYTFIVLHNLIVNDFKLEENIFFDNAIFRFINICVAIFPD